VLFEFGIILNLYLLFMNFIKKITHVFSVVEVTDQKPPEMCNFFHTILFAYQKTAKDILGSGEAVLIHPILDKINLVTNKQNQVLLEEKNLEKILENSLENMLKNGAVKWVDFEYTDDGKYVFHVKGCKYSKHIHEFLNTKDTTCPLALVIMASLQLITGKKIRPTDSEYSKTGTKTVIEFLAPTKKELTIKPLQPY